MYRLVSTCCSLLNTNIIHVSVIAVAKKRISGGRLPFIRCRCITLLYIFLILLLRLVLNFYLAIKQHNIKSTSIRFHYWINIIGSSSSSSIVFLLIVGAGAGSQRPSTTPTRAYCKYPGSSGVFQVCYKYSSIHIHSIPCFLIRFHHGQALAHTRGGFRFGLTKCLHIYLFLKHLLQMLNT